MIWSLYLLIRENVIVSLEKQLHCRNSMVEELDMEQTNNTNLALTSEMVEWFNTTYCYIFVNELRKILAQNNNKNNK